MQNDKLLPCPFCDKKLKKFKGGYEHKSSQCVLSSFILTDVEIPKWNTRKPMERIVNRLEEFKEEKNDIGSKIRNAEDKRCYGFYELGIDEATDIVRKGGVDNAG